jgi:hypothetical protein
MLRAYSKLQNTVVILYNRFVYPSLEKTKSDKENIIKISFISYYRFKISFNSREFGRTETVFSIFFFFFFFPFPPFLEPSFRFFLKNSIIFIFLIFFSSARIFFFFSFFLILKISVILTSEPLKWVFNGEG